MRPCAAAALLCLALGALAGCGPEPEGRGGATLRVTRDFGRELLSSEQIDKPREGQTVMGLLRSGNEVETRPGNASVRAIEGLPGADAVRAGDWFYWVNGLGTDESPAEYELSPGDVVQWDYRDARAARAVRAIVGAFPEPFLHGLEGKRFPVRVECEDAESDACRRVKDTLRAAGVPATGASLGAAGTQNVIRVLVARWARARELPSARAIEQGPGRSGVFARYIGGGRYLELLDGDGESARREGPDTGLIAALRPADKELLWLVTGGSEAGVDNAAAAFAARSLRDAFAVAVPSAGRPVKLPLDAAP